MKYNIRGEKIKITAAIRDYVVDKVGRLNKYFNDSDDVIANVLVKVRGNDEIIEVTIPSNKFVLRAEEVHNDLYAAIDLVTDKLERQIRKNKTRLKKNDEINKYNTFNLDYEINDNEIEKGKIVKRKLLDSKPMDEEEAILQMELLGHDFFMFKDVSGSVCTLYKRKDGDFGLLEIN